MNKKRHKKITRKPQLWSVEPIAVREAYAIAELLRSLRAVDRTLATSKRREEHVGTIR